MHEYKQEVTKVISLVKNAKNLSSAYSPLNVINYLGARLNPQYGH